MINANVQFIGRLWRLSYHVWRLCLDMFDAHPRKFDPESTGRLDREQLKAGSEICLAPSCTKGLVVGHDMKSSRSTRSSSE